MRIPDVRKEVVGGVAAAGLFAGTLALGIPVVFAGAAAAAGFWAAWVLVPKGRGRNEIVVAPGVSREALDAFLHDCGQAIERIERLGKEIGAAPVRQQIQEMLVILRRILSDCRQDPSDIRVEPQLPTLLEMLAGMLERYRDVAPRTLPNRGARAQLAKIEEALGTSVRWLAELEQRMLHNDIMDGTAQAQTLIHVMRAQLEDDEPNGEERR